MYHKTIALVTKPGAVRLLGESEFPRFGIKNFPAQYHFLIQSWRGPLIEALPLFNHRSSIPYFDEAKTALLQSSRPPVFFRPDSSATLEQLISQYENAGLNKPLSQLYYFQGMQVLARDMSTRIHASYSYGHSLEDQMAAASGLLQKASALDKTNPDPYLGLAFLSHLRAHGSIILGDDYDQKQEMLRAAKTALEENVLSEMESGINRRNTLPEALRHFSIAASYLRYNHLNNYLPPNFAPLIPDYQNLRNAWVNMWNRAIHHLSFFSRR